MARWLWAPMLLATLVNAWKTAHHKPTRHINIRGWHLELEENKAIRSPNYDECQFYTGRVAREEQSFASVTECGGQLYGLLQVDGREYVIQPDELRERSHVLRRRDVLLAEQTVVYNLTGDTVSDIELEFEEDDDPLPTPHVRPRHSAISDVQHFRNRFMTITRPLAGVKDLWMEMAIVADSTLLKFHGRERVNHYILALMNIVSAIFSDPSLDSNMTLVINKLFLYEEKDSVIKNGNVKKSLEGVNRWNYKHLTRLPTDTTGWDSTIWLTRASLGGPSGYAPVGGVCSRTRSSAIVRDEGLTSAFVIAHELAHLLGLTHDDDKCQLDFQIGYVMAPTVLATLQAYAWSKCSKEQFHEKKGRWWCLHQRSGEEGLELGGAREVKNYVFTMDEQCRTEFGEGFSVCKTVKVRSACSRLWCAQRGIPHVCRSKRGAPLEGTPCGENKWCVDRVCEPMPGPVVTNLTRQFPSWGDWGPCNAECGYGLKKRECLLNGTISKEPCDGATTQLATCWSGVSCGTKDRRGDLCQKHNNRLIPYIQPEESKACEIWCVSYTGGEPVTYGSMPDGAPCSYEMPYDTCYQGTCVKGQCDPSDPDCNWCSEGYCNNNTHYYTRQLSEGWTRITVLPHEARTFSVRLVTPVPLYIALRERRKDTHILELDNHSRRKDDAISKYFKYERNVPQNLQIVDVNSNVIDINEDRRELEGAAVVGGTFVKWRQTDNEIIMTSVSKLLSDLMILAIPENRLMNDEVLTVEVVVNYSTSALRAKPMNYKIEKGPCSVSCGGGLRTVWQRCYSEQHCPPPRLEPCNTHSCVFVWKPGEWEECSATCGDAGVQERQLYCIPANITTSTKRDLIRHSVSPVLCPGSNLTRQQPCNQIPCPVYWQEMAWTPCSTTCGRGTTYRPLSCPAENEVLCGPKPRERRRRCRLRRCPPAARTPRPCPARDATQYCELFTPGQLNRNCLVPSFRKYCCNACRYSDSLKH